jgi:hypothetical protein
VPKLEVFTTQGFDDESVRDVRVRVVADQRSAAIDAPEVSVRVLNAQTLAGIEAIADASDVDAFVTSDWTARVPLLRLAPVSVRAPKLQTCDAVRLPDPPLLANCNPIDPAVTMLEVATFQTSEAKVPKVVRDRVADAQTLSGMVAPSEVDAVKTVALVLLLIVVTAPDTWELVLVFTASVPDATTCASEVDAARVVALVLVFTDVIAPETWELVLVFTASVPDAVTCASDVDAARIDAFVLVLIAVCAADTCALVLVFTANVPDAVTCASEVEAARIDAFVFAFTLVVTAAIDVPSELEAAAVVPLMEVVALVISDKRASDPLESEPLVKVRPPNDQT